MDFREALDAARSLNVDGPHSVHGRKLAVMDLLLDCGTAFGADLDGVGGQIASVFGIDVHYDEAMAENVVDFRHRDGRTLYRMIQHDGKWFRLNVDLLRFP